ncbi:hypothetical protein Tco_1497270 [Tanacetum coccineum]
MVSYTSPGMKLGNDDFLIIIITKPNKRNQNFMLERRKHGILHPKQLFSIMNFFIKPPSHDFNQLTGPQEELSLVSLFKCIFCEEIFVIKVVGGG